MCWLQSFLNCETLRNILTNDFKCGYFAATLVMLLILLLVIALKIICFFVFRHPKCSEVVVKSPAGDLVISVRVISALIGRLLSEEGRLNDVKVSIRRYKKNYKLFVRASYAEGYKGLPVLIEELQPQLAELLKQQFGIENTEPTVFLIYRLSEIEDNDGDTGF